MLTGVPWDPLNSASSRCRPSSTRRGPKGRLAQGRLAKGRTQRGLKHSETYRTPIFCTVPLPKVPLVPSNPRALRPPRLKLLDCRHCSFVESGRTSESDFATGFPLEIPMRGFPFQRNFYDKYRIPKNNINNLFLKGFHLKRNPLMGILSRKQIANILS